MTRKKKKIIVNLMLIGKVETLDFWGRAKSVDVNDLAIKLNSLQDVFDFNALGTPLNIGPRDDLRGHKLDTIFDGISKRNETVKQGLAIGIISSRLEDSSWNRHDEDNGVGVITIKDYENYLPIGKNVDQYLMYLLLCESFCLETKTHLEHEQPYQCLFDLCGDDEKNEFIESLNNPHIHTNAEGSGRDGCWEKLLGFGYSEDDLNNVGKALNYINRRSFLGFVASVSKSPLAGYYIGIIISLSASLVSQLFPDIAIWVVIGLISLFTLVLLLRFSLSRNFTIS